MIRVEAGAASEVEDMRIFDEWSNGFLDVSSLDEGVGTLADLVVGRLDGVVLSWHVGISCAVTMILVKDVFFFERATDIRTWADDSAEGVLKMGLSRRPSQSIGLHIPSTLKE